MSSLGVSVAINMILLFFLLAAGVVLLIVYLKGKKEDIKKNSTILLSFAPQFTKGHSVFLEEECILDNKGRTLSKIIPKDVDEDSEEIIKKTYLVSAPGCRVVLPAGTNSKYRNVALAFPPNPEQLPRPFLETQFGKSIFHYLNYQNIITMMDERFKTMRETLSKAGKAGEETVTQVLVENHHAMIEAINDMWKKEDKLKPRMGDYQPLQP